MHNAWNILYRVKLCASPAASEGTLPLQKVPLISPLTCSLLSCYSPQEKQRIRNKSKTFIALCLKRGGLPKEEQLHGVHAFQTWRRLRVLNIKSPGSYPCRFTLAEKCYSCSTLSPISLYHNSFVHFSSESWSRSGGEKKEQKGTAQPINADALLSRSSASVADAS